MGTCVRVSQQASRTLSYLLPTPCLQPRRTLNTVSVFPLRLLALQQCQKGIIKVLSKIQYLINQHCPQCHVPSALISDKEKATAEQIQTPHYYKRQCLQTACGPTPPSLCLPGDSKGTGSPLGDYLLHPDHLQLSSVSLCQKRSTFPTVPQMCTLWLAH